MSFLARGASSTLEFFHDGRWTRSHPVSDDSIFFSHVDLGLSDFRFLAEVAQGWQDLLPCFPTQSRGHLVDKSPGLGNVCWKTPTVVIPLRTTQQYFPHGDLGLSGFRFLAKVAQGW